MFVQGRLLLFISTLSVSTLFGTFSETSRTPCGCNLYFARVIPQPVLGNQLVVDDFIHDGLPSVILSSASADTDGPSPHYALSRRGTSFMEKENYRA